MKINSIDFKGRMQGLQVSKGFSVWTHFNGGYRIMLTSNLDYIIGDFKNDYPEGLVNTLNEYGIIYSENHYIAGELEGEIINRK
jgi:hypothetical protein